MIRWLAVALTGLPGALFAAFHAFFIPSGYEYSECDAWAPCIHRYDFRHALFFLALFVTVIAMAAVIVWSSMQPERALIGAAVFAVVGTAGVCALAYWTLAWP
jgi:hypothetical protein